MERASACWYETRTLANDLVHDILSKVHENWQKPRRCTQVGEQTMAALLVANGKLKKSTE